MKILQINATYGNTSTGSIVYDIDNILQKASYQSKVACIVSSVQSDNIILVGTKRDRKWHALWARITGKQAFYSKKSTRKFLKKLQGDMPDIIHLHNIHSNFLNLPILINFVKKNKIPLVITFHDCWYFTGKCYHFLDNGCDKWKTLCEKCPKRYKDIPSIFFDSSKNVFTKKKHLFDMENLYIVGCSKWVSEEARQSPLLEKAQIFQIYNGIEPSLFNPDRGDLREELGLENSFVLVTMANKWFDSRNKDIRKGVLDWLKSKDAKAIIIGCSEEQIKDYQSVTNTICLGFIKDREYLVKAYNTASVFLNLTFVDTLPTVNMEAASCGVPIITYNSGGSGELVLEGKTGYVIQPLDQEALICSLEKVRDGKIEKVDCRKWAIENFDKEKNYQKYLDLYQNILDK